MRYLRGLGRVNRRPDNGSVVKLRTIPPDADKPVHCAPQQESDIGRLPWLFYGLLAVLLLAAMSSLAG